LFLFQGEKYFGERSKAELIAFALSSIQAPVLDLSAGNFEAEVADQERAALPWVMTFCGEGADCLELETCQKLAAMLKDLANVAVVNCHSDSQETVCHKHGIEPGTYYFKAGEVARGEGIVSVRKHLGNIK